MDGVFFTILFIVGTPIVLMVGAIKLRRYSIDKYGFSCTSVGNVTSAIFSVLAAGLFLLTSYAVYESSDKFFAWINRLISFSTRDGDLTALFLSGLSVGLLVWVFFRTRSNTSSLVALGTIITLWPLGLLFIVAGIIFSISAAS